MFADFSHQTQLAGLSGAGFQIVTREGIDGAAGDDEELAAAVAACKEADPPNPIPPELYAKLLKKMFDEPAPEEVPQLEAEGPVGELVTLEHGPRCFKVFINDFPTSDDMPVLEAALEVCVTLPSAVEYNLTLSLSTCTVCLACVCGRARYSPNSNNRNCVVKAL